MDMQKLVCAAGAAGALASFMAPYAVCWRVVTTRLPDLQVAQAGRIVLLSFHQPSPAMYELLDRAFLMSKGHVVFCGEPSAAYEHFEHAGVFSSNCLFCLMRNDLRCWLLHNRFAWSTRKLLWHTWRSSGRQLGAWLLLRAKLRGHTELGYAIQSRSLTCSRVVYKRTPVTYLPVTQVGYLIDRRAHALQVCRAPTTPLLQSTCWLQCQIPPCHSA